MRRILAAAVFAALAGCAATPYQPIGTTIEGGYSSNRLSDSDFEVSFRGNGFTEPRRALDYVYLRAAETALEHNFEYFVVIGQSDRSSSELISMGATSTTTGSISPYGSFAATTVTSPSAIPVFKPAQTIKIRCIDIGDESNKHLGRIYSAKEIVAQMKAEYGLK